MSIWQNAGEVMGWMRARRPVWQRLHIREQWMTRKLGRLLVVGLVLSAMVAPATLAGAIDLPTCGDIEYNAADPSHILYPTDVWELKSFYNHALVWTDAPLGDPIPYLNVDLSGMEGPLVVFPDLDALRAAPWSVPGAFQGVRIVGTAGDDVICGLPWTAAVGDLLNGARGLTPRQAPPVWGNVIKGGAGDDTIIAGSPLGGPTPTIDLFFVGGAFNVLVGGPGDDLIAGDPHAFDGVLGGAGADTIYGDGIPTPGPSPYGVDGFMANEMYGGAGADTIIGGYGPDKIGGQGGNDTIWGGAGMDELVGGAGGDAIHGLAPGDESTMDGGNFIAGMGGNDTLTGAGSADEIRGGAGDDTINTGACHAAPSVVCFGFPYDKADGGLGDDTITGGAGSGILYGGPGNDTIHGGSGVDLVYGDAAAPYGPGHPFYGLEGIDTLYGDNDGDELWGGLGADTVYGGLGIDFLYGAYSPSSCASEDDAADTMYGDYGNDYFYGAIGDLDKAIEQYEAGSDDRAFNVEIIPAGNVEHVLYGDAVCVPG
jgi:Ca2+-binding RTX toxin-like protein